MDMIFSFLQYFKKEEFNHPELMQARFLFFLENVRAKAGIPFHLTSDARTEEENTRVGGSPTSLHRTGMAVDFTIKPWTSENLWKVNRAVVLCAENMEGAIELELVDGPSDRHVHLGLFPSTQKKESKLVLEVD